MKRIVRTIGYFFIINMLLFMFHVFAFVGYAFNDSSVFYDDVILLLPMLFKIFCPMIIGSIFLIYIFSKKIDVNKFLLYILQFILICMWILLYINSYVPNLY